MLSIQMGDLLVIMAATKEQGLMRRYMTQLALAGIEYVVEPIADFEEANTLGSQIKRERALTEKFAGYRKLVFSDAFDVLFYGNKEDVIRKIPEDCVLLAAERNCYPDKTLAKEMPGLTPWRFANGGLLAGTPDQILTWFAYLEDCPIYRQEWCNQSFFNVLNYTSKLGAVIDEKTELFYCLYDEVRELEFQENLPINTVLGTRPNFIHANGHSAMVTPNGVLYPEIVHI